MSSFEVISKPSFYLDDAYYEALIAWRDKASTYGPVTDADVVMSSAALIHYEARLLDTRRFYDWIELYTEDCVYWLPAAPQADPRREVTVMFDDRRRMEDRIIRFETGYAHNQEPERKLQRMITNLEAWQSDDGQSRRVMAVEHVFEIRRGKPQSEHVASLDFWLVKQTEGWKIKVKKAQLINSEEGLEAPTFL